MSNYSIIVHGGAWAIPEDRKHASIKGCEEAVKIGSKILERGGSALEAVEAAVRIMEDDPIFDAGYGSVLNMEGHVEMDALIMNGEDLGLGAVACVRRVKNPISLARLVMQKTPHTLLVGEGALRFAQEMQVPLAEKDEDLVTPEALQEWKVYKSKYVKAVGDLFNTANSSNPPIPILALKTLIASAAADNQFPKGKDTVGCVAWDSQGRIAVATSTGGITGKRPGRVGDSPLVGCGGYANSSGGCSTTGHGESISKVTLARHVIYLIEAGEHPGMACKNAIKMMKEKVNGSGGVISIDQKGRVGFDFSTVRMAYAYCEHKGKLVSGIEAEMDKQVLHSSKM